MAHELLHVMLKVASYIKLQGAFAYVIRLAAQRNPQQTARR
jgi:hypothetical protein